jgi:hypothetical protein
MSEHEELTAESAQLEHRLLELRELAPLPLWQRIEDALRLVVRLYGGGLARALDHARTAGAGPAFDQLLADDELLASLLVLHGLHPMSTEDRVRRALGQLRSELGVPDDALVLVAIRDGVVQLATGGTLGGGAMSSNLAEGIVKRVIEAAAPEIESIAISGLAPRRDPTLVQLRRARP